MADGNILAPFKPKNHDHEKCVAEAIAAAEARCARDGRSFTPLRRRVLELVWSSHGPVGAYELLDELRAERRGAAPPTVYRALDFLMGNGLIHRIESLNAYVGCGSPDQRDTCRNVGVRCGTADHRGNRPVPALHRGGRKRGAPCPVTATTPY